MSSAQELSLSIEPEDDAHPAQVHDELPGVLREAAPPARHGELISRLARSRYAVSADTEIYALASAMDHLPAVHAVGVVDHEGTAIGLVTRQHLFDHLGKMYGRDLYKRKAVAELVTEARIFRDDLSTTTVAEMLRKDLRRMEDTWYLLADAAGKFRGVFSSKDLLIYLSELTARDIALARRLQTAIVHEQFAMMEKRFELSCISRMAREVGGDFYIARELDQHRLLVGLCDVSGKGIAASLVTAVLGGIFNTFTAATSLRAFLRSLNGYIFETFQLEYFVTGAFVELDLVTGQATMCDMGHSYVLVSRGDTLLRAPSRALNPPLGVARDITPILSAYTLGAGDLAVLFTDGVVEQRNKAGEEYSEKRLWKMLRGNASLPVGALAEALTADVATYRGEQPQGDDLTCVLLRYCGSSE